ncbi:hypothetical protein FAZ19_22410 [Sphingobacterium alkalisoli]|uniref:Uncharacterized protein n=1 Tax=Sphingobacterium alkalisoli TaxID=1874115 RepID=A0A4U0GPW7_9SPHI|nr:hypothetical protein [Sphingobacterium alkalisoli]TJY60696.1 hypothetical protein FAZ19_22410 [Sphingobacterium alkalisoli]GGH31391.1 hypothetical protein GCM10011418_44140 [Sphingobacterium alkalisoli]
MGNFFDLFDRTVQFLDNSQIRYDFTKFDSGAIVLDIWYKNKFYVFQFDIDNVGVSEVGEDVAFDSRADKIIKDEKLFILEVQRVFFDIPNIRLS